MNFRPKQREQNQIDESTLKKYLDMIKEKDPNARETLVIEQIQAIKYIIMRPSFSLGDQQITQIHKKYNNMCINRKEKLYAAKKNDKMKKLNKEAQFQFKPRINSKSRDIEMRNKDTSRSRTDQMYNYAKKYDQHKEELKD